MTAKELIKEKLYICKDTEEDEPEDIHDSLSRVEECMIEFAKHHIQEAFNMQMNKYYAGTSGYLTVTDKEDLINNIK